MSNLRLAVIPAAGRAVRLNGLPKFLLPIGTSGSLLSYHLKMASEYADLIVIGTRPEFSGLVLGLGKDFGAKVCVVETQTLTETIVDISSGLKPRTLTVHLPDTFVGESNVYAKLESEVNERGESGLALFRSEENQRGVLGQVEVENHDHGSRVLRIVDKDPSFFTGYHWGSICFFKPDVESWDTRTATIGDVAANLVNNGEKFFSIQSKSEYVDLGTLDSLRGFYAKR